MVLLKMSWSSFIQGSIEEMLLNSGYFWWNAMFPSLVTWSSLYTINGLLSSLISVIFKLNFKFGTYCCWLALFARSGLERGREESLSFFRGELIWFCITMFFLKNELFTWESDKLEFWTLALSTFTFARSLFTTEIGPSAILEGAFENSFIFVSRVTCSVILFEDPSKFSWLRILVCWDWKS